MAVATAVIQHLVPGERRRDESEDLFVPPAMRDALQRFDRVSSIAGIV
jgi:hypothetical protein